MAAPNESSEDVNDFLQRIRELGERRDKEDDERTKKLEEEILQGRKERQARRAERARSLALTDDSSTLNIARLSASSINPGSINPPEHLEPTLQTQPEASGGLASRKDTEPITDNTRRGSLQEFGIDSQPRQLPTLSRSRAGTMSWQQRPHSREFGSMSPGSTSPTRSPTRASHLRHHSTASDNRPRSQYGFPRLSKDFLGLHHSPERSVDSVNRGKEDQDRVDQADPEVEDQVLEGSQIPSAKLDKLEAVEERPSSPPRSASRDSNFSHRFSVSSVSAGLGSPVHLSEAQKLEPRQADSSFEEPTVSPTQRRMSPERSRSTSPTKGMGGFVQSAMMRRSDSVSKRWSAQIPQGLSRSNSIISNRSSVAGPSVNEMGPPPPSHSRGDSSALSPRPDSSHSDAPTETTERPTTPFAPALPDKDTVLAEGSPTRSSRPNHSRSASSVTAEGSDAQSSPFVSKTMDPRRWSPSKATWLESALNRPEAPRQSARPSSQPNWARDRQSRGSIDMGRVNSFKEVTPVGLMRTPPLGLVKKSGVSGPSLPSSPNKDMAPESPLGFSLKRTNTSDASIPGSSDTKYTDTVPESPLRSPLKRPSISNPSISESPETAPMENLPEIPAESPFDTSTIPDASLFPTPATESPSRHLSKSPSVPEIPQPETPQTHLEGMDSASPSENSFTKAGISGASLSGSLEGIPKEPISKPLASPSDSNAEGTNEDTSTPPAHIQETLEALSGAQSVEKPKLVLSDEVNIGSTQPPSPQTQTPTEPEVAPEPAGTPTARDPPKSLVSPKPNFSISPSSRGAIAPNPKPVSSPVVDFRANLKKREIVKDNGEEKEPEFKNVFGRLKKTETRNYVAPDELKGNILRGKAALNTTGGPKKTERVDEFRNSLVSRKNEMKVSGGSIRRNTASEKDAPKPAETVPEAIAKRQNMNRANSTKTTPTVEPVSPSKSVGSRASLERKPFSPSSSVKEIGSSRTSQEPEPLSPFPTDDGLDEPGWPLKNTTVPAPPLSQNQQQVSPPVEPVDKKPEAAHAGIADQHTSDLKHSSQEEIHRDVRSIESIAEKEQLPAVAKIPPLRELPQAPVSDTTASPVQATKNKLAGRINPALAGLLSRGPPAPTGPKKEVQSISTHSSPVPAAPLAHATKGRARGPKRRPPQAVLAPSSQDHTKEVGAIPYSETTPSQTPSSPVESSHECSGRVSQCEISVPDTETPRPESFPPSPVADQSPIEKLPAEQLPVEHLPFEQSLSQRLPADEPPSEQRFEEVPPVQLSSTERFLDDQSFNEQPSIEQPSIEQLSTEQPSTEQPSTEQPSTEQPSTEQPSIEQPSIEQPSIEQPSIEQPSTEQPSTEQPSTEQPSIEQPSIEQPSTEQPSIEQPSIEQPSIEQPSIEQPSIEQPSIEQPSTEGPSTEGPSTEHPLPLPTDDFAVGHNATGLLSTGEVSVQQLSIEQLSEVKPVPPVPPKGDLPVSRSPRPVQSSSSPERAPQGPVSTREPSPPPAPPKSHSPVSPSPSTLKSKWTQQSQYPSPSPSPLKTSYNGNRRDPATAADIVPGVTVDQSRENLSRPLSRPSPPVPPKDHDATLQKPVDPRRLSRKMSAPSLVAQASEAREVIAGFFKTFPNPQNRMDIDPQVMLTTKTSDSKSRTMKRHIWELTGDGRRQELPSHQEYILYQGSMYICVHLYGTERSTTTEVYLWRGDDVPDAAIDNEQPFARKVARENGSKLQVIRQGKEPTRFIQALGGIIITRRGSSSRHNSSALYMLCGRKHLGQMAFDEVDYSLRNLCSGFPCVVSAPFGKLYLWKGKGSGPEEIGAARLIGMDLGLTGEFEEVGEGEEPEDFFDVFAGPREAAPHMCQDYWKLKPKYHHYRTRLLRVDHELGQPIRFWNLRRPGSGSLVLKPNDCVQEIEPFCYRDLTEKDIYVLDTFFEIYVIIGEQASQKSADFASAVVFAHEYGILATSLQDRPFIPKSFVALGGVAGRCQSAFRKWKPRNHHEPFVFPLDVVIEALRSPEDE